MKIQIVILFLTIIWGFNCYLNPYFLNITGLNQEEENNDTLTLLLGLGSGGGLTSNGSGSDGTESPNPPDRGSPLPPRVTYPFSSRSYVRGFSIPMVTPSVEGAPFLNCTSTPEFPIGLFLESKDCSFRGNPSDPQDFINYTITATNALGGFETSLQIRITMQTGNDDWVNLSILVEGLPIGEVVAFMDVFGGFYSPDSNGIFSYTERYLVGLPYSFQITQQPETAFCTIFNSDGTVGFSNPTITISCN